MTRWLPPVYREPASPRRVRALGRVGPSHPALRLVTIGLLTLLACLLGMGIAWVIVL
jgi:hypothetical protein